MLTRDDSSYPLPEGTEGDTVFNNPSTVPVLPQFKFTKEGTVQELTTQTNVAPIKTHYKLKYVVSE